MQPPPSPTPPQTLGSALLVALPYLGAIAASVLGWFAAQFSTVARLEKTLLGASQSFVEQAQALRAQDGARISELEAEIIRQRGLIRGHQQWEDSVRRWARRSNVDLPNLEDRR
jgi:hypothetical protein